MGLLSDVSFVDGGSLGAVSVKDWTVGKFGDQLAKVLGQLFSTRILLVSMAKSGQWTSEMEKAAAKWETERQEYNKRIREFKNLVKQQTGETIKIAILNSKDKADALSFEGFSEFGYVWIVIGATAAAVALIGFGAWAAKNVAASLAQEVRIKKDHDAVYKLLAKLPPEAQQAILTEQAKAEQAAVGAKGAGILSTIKNAFSVLPPGTKWFIGGAFALAAGYAGYKVYRKVRK